MNTILKKLTIVLIIILITAISFGGIYVKKLNKMENIIPSYLLGTDFKGKRVLSFKVSETQDAVNEEINSENNSEENSEQTNSEGDAEQNIIEESTEKDNSVENTEKNESKEILTKENYEKVKEIFQTRLSKLKAEEYYIRTNNENGDIIVEVPDNDKTDLIYSALSSKGKFTIIDKDTEEVLIDGSNVKSTEVLSNTTSTGTTLYLQIKFDKEGTEKLKEISNIYVEKTSEENSEANEETDAENVENEDSALENVENEDSALENANATENTDITEEAETMEDTDSSDEKNISYISIKLDDSTLTTTYFGEEIPTGVLQLPLAQNITDSKTLYQYYDSLSTVSTVINSGELPINYDLENDNYIKSGIDIDTVKLAVYIGIAILVIITLVLIIKYKFNGVLAAILGIGYLATVLLVIRYTNVALNIGGIVAIVAMTLLDYVFLIKYLNKIKQEHKNAFSDTMKEFFIMNIPTCVLAVVFTFFSELNISTIGMVTFWSILLLVLNNLIFTKNLLNKKSK